jgi:hypothetical protein
MFYPKVNTSPKWVFPNTLCVYLSPQLPSHFFYPVQLTKAKRYLMDFFIVRIYRNDRKKDKKNHSNNW